MADERSVDVDEVRGDQPPPETGPHPPVVAVGRLSPVQQAYSHYVTHTLACQICLDADVPDCDTGLGLWQAYREQGNEAYGELRKLAP